MFTLKLGKHFEKTSFVVDVHIARFLKRFPVREYELYRLAWNLIVFVTTVTV